MADAQVAEVRAFNRCYTGVLGLLDEHQLDSPFTLTEMRILYELAHGTGLSAAWLCRALGLDAGYCSRLIGGLVRRGLVVREADRGDGRRSLLSLTEAGRAAFAGLDRASSARIAALLAPLCEPDRAVVVGAMRAIRARLDPGAAAPDWELRPLGPGDLGWIVHRHGALYAAEYGLDARFEALVAEVAAAFVRGQDPARERAWVAARGGEILGSVFVMAKSAEMAQLRLLYVEPAVRGVGVGGRLVDAAIGFAGAAGYREITLWTNDILHAARRLYQRAGFRLVGSEPHRSFGRDLVGETWTLGLERAPGQGAA